jgi:hypothetical protein
MDITFDARARRLHTRQMLLALLMLGAAALVVSIAFFGINVYASSLPAFHWQFPLLGGATAEIGVVAGCPPTMPEMACLHVADQFPPAFRAAYWSAGETSTLLLVDLPQVILR